MNLITCVPSTSFKTFSKARQHEVTKIVNDFTFKHIPLRQKPFGKYLQGNQRNIISVSCSTSEYSKNVQQEIDHVKTRVNRQFRCSHFAKLLSLEARCGSAFIVKKNKNISPHRTNNYWMYDFLEISIFCQSSMNRHCLHFASMPYTSPYHNTLTPLYTYVMFLYAIAHLSCNTVYADMSVIEI